MKRDTGIASIPFLLNIGPQVMLACVNTQGGPMANKKERTKTEERFEFELDHADVVGMMNDPDVLIDDGDVASDQVFQVILKKSNGGEIILKDMTSTDTLVFRFTKITIVDNTTEFGGIDIET